MRQMLINLGQSRWVAVSHQDRDREGIHAPLQGVGRPGMAQHVERVLRGNSLGVTQAELPPRLDVEASVRFADDDALQRARLRASLGTNS